ncbi:MAG: DUF2225 domain-containing protein [Spirochaetes bacterium]|nr:DUF2225 domain-containing protein [Spirochaetota bacterium]
MVKVTQTVRPKEEKERKITFFAKEANECPVCGTKFHREELFQGRVNAGELTDELHRKYIPMQSYGEVAPLIYSMTVCPSCFFSAFKGDFPKPPPKTLGVLSELTQDRIEKVQRIFSPIDFEEPRKIVDGAASYYLAMLCYDLFPPQSAPTVKMGMCSIRTAWLCGDLHAKQPNENYNYLSGIFYQKARILYKAAIEFEQTAREQASAISNLGPDTDKNYGYEGALYMAGMLELKYGQRVDTVRRDRDLDVFKRSIAKMFGLGKRSKAKPGPLLDTARELYDRIKAELRVDDDE